MKPYPLICSTFLAASQALAQTPPPPPTGFPLPNIPSLPGVPSAQPPPAQPPSTPGTQPTPTGAQPPPMAPLQPGATTPQAAQGDPAANAPGALFDNRLPMLDPSGGLLRFNGQTWDINNNAIFRSRFEKYLNTPEESGPDEKAHREILNKIIVLLDPNNLKAQTLSDAYRLLARAATYPGDSRLCDTLANAIYSVWATKRSQQRLEEANRILEDENLRLRRNMAQRASEETFQKKADGKSGQGGNAPVAMTPPPSGTQPPPQPAQSGSPGSLTLSTNSSNPSRTGANGGSGNATSNTTARIQLPSGQTAPLPSASDGNDSASKGVQQANSDFSNATGRSIALAGYAEKLVENSIKVKANSLKGDVSELQAKVEYQSLMVQLFLQRRFHHVIIGTRFYRALFGEGDSKLSLPESAQSPFMKGSGLPPTVATLESLANEAMRDVQTSVQAFHKLVEIGELRSASERLRDALLIGEFMPELRTLPFERKRKVLRFVQKSNELLSALEVKDYTLAGELLNGAGGLRAIAPDFDASKPNALIETSRNAARLHLAKARNAAISGDKAGFEAALKEAAAIWPNNPELSEVAGKAFAQGDQMAQTLLELEQLIAQKNLRRIAEEAGRFLAAAQTARPEKQAQIKQILDDFKAIEGALMAAKEMDRQGNSAGAWETVDRISKKFPDDLQLNQASASFTTKAADFVRTLQNAQEHEKRSELASSLAWYLKAQKLYPKSDTAETAIQRIKEQILPQATH